MLKAVFAFIVILVICVLCGVVDARVHHTSAKVYFWLAAFIALLTIANML